jgi:hypothetical protein
MKHVEDRKLIIQLKKEPLNQGYNQKEEEEKLEIFLLLIHLAL